MLELCRACVRFEEAENNLKPVLSAIYALI